MAIEILGKRGFKILSGGRSPLIVDNVPGGVVVLLINVRSLKRVETLKKVSVLSLIMIW